MGKVLDLGRMLQGFWVLCSGMSTLGCATSTEKVGEEQLAAIVSKKIGIHDNQGSYQNSWQSSLENSAVNVTGVSNELTKVSGVTLDYWYNLRGKRYYWHETGDQATNSLESVDMFITYTHGGVNVAGVTGAAWAMWDDGSIADSNLMRLGDESRGLSLFVQFSCDTLAWDSGTWGRWSPVFKGGLRIATGAHHLLPASSTGVGKVFGQKLNAGHTIVAAWGEAWDLGDTTDDANPAVMASGNSDADCATRRDNMTWNNFSSYPRRRDAAMTRLCEWQWSNL